MLFSERMGFKKIEDTLIMDSIPTGLRNRINNILLSFLEEVELINKSKLDLLYTKIMDNFFKKSRRNFSLSSFAPGFFDNINRELEKGAWYSLYDLIEFICELPYFDSIFDNYVGKLNKVLEQERSAYRFVKSQFIPLVDDIAIKAIDSVEKSPFVYAQNHIQNALGLLSAKSSKPDCNKIVWEAITAVESSLIQVAGLDASKNNTPGPAVKELIKKFNIDETFLKPFLQLYGAASNNGIRHSGNEYTKICDVADAILV
ncbi:AbiJ-NTD4 domain-containing protein [Listeria kieliensis]